MCLKGEKKQHKKEVEGPPPRGMDGNVCVRHKRPRDPNKINKCK